MEKQLILFEGKEVLILLPEEVVIDFKGEFLIHAGDVAGILDYSRALEVTKFCKQDQVFIVKNSDVAKNNIRKLNNAGEAFITNLALNRVLGKSEKPKAEPFQDWLYEDMLPSVQKHGAYMTPETIEKTLNDPDFIISLATKLKEEQQKNKALQVKIEEQEPLVSFAEICLQSDKSVKIRDLAHSLSSHGIKTGQNKLFDKLREWKLICQNSTEPTQAAINLGLFEISQGVKQKPNGEMFMWRTPYVTVKGQVYIADRLKRAYLLVESA